MKGAYYFQKLLKALRAQQLTGGLEISDAAVRFARFDGTQWQRTVQRLTPNILENGTIKDYPQFVNALRALHAQIEKRPKAKHKISVVASLSSLNVYTQVFSLPFIEKDKLEQAVQLNLQAVSPSESGQDYSGWQIVGEDEANARIEVLSAFINRALLDELHRALADAGFLVVAFEFRALALARLIREQGRGFDPKKSYLVLNLNDAGVDFLMIRHSQLYFEYFISWRDVQGDERELTQAVFRTALVRATAQVLNFYNQQWGDQVTELFVAAGELNEQVKQVVAANVQFNIQELVFRPDPSLKEEWFVVVGSGIRAEQQEKADGEVNFLGQEIQEEIQHHHTLAFLKFWRVFVPLAFTVLLITFMAANFFLAQTRQSLEASASLTVIGGQEVKVIEELETKVRQFNQSVDIIRAAKDQLHPKTPILERIEALTRAKGITVNRLALKDEKSPAQLIGEARSEEEIRAFKQLLEEDDVFQNVTLPLSEIKTTPQQTVSFSISFSINPTARK